MSISFSFIYNSSSLRFGLIPWQFQNKIFKPMKVIKGYLSWMVMRCSGLLEGFRLFGTALVKLLGGEVAFKVMDGFEVVVLRDELILVPAKRKGWGGGGQERCFTVSRWSL